MSADASNAVVPTIDVKHAPSNSDELSSNDHVVPSVDEASCAMKAEAVVAPVKLSMPSPSPKPERPAVSPGSSTPPVPPARHKKKKVTELKCSEVRWFHRKLETDKWTTFNGRDSLSLEVKYRSILSIALDEETEAYIDENSLRPGEMVVVLDGLYKLTTDMMKIESIYWKDDSCDVRRGTWFTQDWQPIESPLADSIDRHHLQYFRGHTVPEGLTVFSPKEASNKPQLTELHLENIEVKWSSVIDIYLSGKRGAFMRYLGWTKSQALRRGFEKDAEWADAPAEISHLILVVHGIGQKGYENLIAQNAQQVREGVVAAMEKGFVDEKTRPMFLPVEWRSSLKLDNGLTDEITLPKMSSMRSTLNSTAMDIMYYQSPLYRREIIGGVVAQLNRIYTLFCSNNPNFHGPVSLFAHSLGSVITYDILTHWSPALLYDQYVTQAINEQIDSCTDDESTNAMVAFQEARHELHEKLKGGIKQVFVTKEEQLLFKVKYLFAVGSPLAVFLLMRGATYRDLLPQFTNVERIFNIFHPYDPVAYRLEPLFASEYKNIRPIKLFAYNDLRGRSCYDDLPTEVHKTYLKKLKNQKKKNNGTEKPIADMRSGEEDEEDECDSDEEMKSGCSSPRSGTPPLGEMEKPAKKGWFSFGSSSSSTKKNAAQATVVEQAVEVAKEAEAELPLPERILGTAQRVRYRMDFQLQPALTDKSYWSVLKSHFAYWTNQDLALFMANCLYYKRKEENEAKSSL